MLVRQPVTGYAASCAAVRDADHTGLVGRIAAPTLVVVGDQDGSTPPDLVRATADLIPGARFEIIAGAGHIPCVEQPAALAALLRDFFKQQDLQPRRIKRTAAMPSAWRPGAQGLATPTSTAPRRPGPASMHRSRH